MTDNRGEPWAVKSMDELLALARAMEQEAIAGYVALAERMRHEDRSDLAEVFEALRAEEEGHLGNVERWIGRAHLATPPAVPQLPPIFDDEGAFLVAPELLSSYRAFSTAVRNEERAFVFWTYVAAHAQNDDIRHAAERMAREELAHVAILRRARRLAFHDERNVAVSGAGTTPSSLEARLSQLLEERALRSTGKEAERFAALASEARQRSGELLVPPLSPCPSLGAVSDRVAGGLLPLCQFLLDFYLDFSDRARNEEAKLRAQELAGSLIRCLHAVRAQG